MALDHKVAPQEYPIRALVRAGTNCGIHPEGEVRMWRKDGDLYWTKIREGGVHEWFAYEYQLEIPAEERSKAGLPAEPSEGKKEMEPSRGEGREDAPPLSPQLIAAMTQGLFEFSKAAPEALEKIKKNGFVFDGSGDRWEKLAFTLYSSLVEISHQSEGLIENYEAEVDPEGHAARPESQRLFESMPSARSAPEAPEGSPSLPSAPSDAIEKAFRAGFDAGMDYGQDLASWDSMRHSDHPDEDKALGEYLAALSKLEGK